MDSDHASSPVLTFMSQLPTFPALSAVRKRSSLCLSRHSIAWRSVMSRATPTARAGVPSSSENSPAGENPGVLAVPAEPVLLFEIAALLGGLGEGAQDSLVVPGVNGPDQLPYVASASLGLPGDHRVEWARHRELVAGQVLVPRADACDLLGET